MNKRNELLKEIYEYDKQIEKNKTKRMITIILLYIFVNSFLFYVLVDVLTKSMDINKFIMCVVLATIYSVISYFANVSIFAKLTVTGETESKVLEGMKKRLEKYDEENNIEEKLPFENFFINRHK